MGIITVKVPDKVEKEFRQTLSAKHDHVIKKGDFQKGFSEAMKDWTEKNKPKDSK